MIDQSKFSKSPETPSFTALKPMVLFEHNLPKMHNTGPSTPKDSQVMMQPGVPHLMDNLSENLSKDMPKSDIDDSD